MAGNARLDARLTEREHQVLELVAAGLRDHDIADRLRIARSTVAMLLRSSMAKLDARTRVEAARRAAGGEEWTCVHPSPPS